MSMRRKAIAACLSALVICAMCFALVPSLGFATEESNSNGTATPDVVVNDTSKNGSTVSNTNAAGQTEESLEGTKDSENQSTTDNKSEKEDKPAATTQGTNDAANKDLQAEALSTEEAAAEAAADGSVRAESSDAAGASDAKVAAEVSKGEVSRFLDSASGPTVAYRTHVQTYGWEGGFATNGAMSGTTGQAKRLEAIQMGVRVPGVSGGVRYFVHRQTYGWESGWKYDGEQSGTTGEAKRLEAIRIELTGDLAKQYSIFYRVHVQTFGWEGWVKDGAQAGTTGLAKRLEGIEVRLVRKGAEQLSPVSGALVNYNVHCQTFGWLDTVADGAESGTTGLAKRLEGIHIKLGSQVAGGIEYNTHVQSHGWLPTWAKNGQMSGTTGEAKRLEAIQIRLTDGAQSKYDVWYRVHAQSYGWLGWAKNGEKAGTAGLAKRLESIQIKLLPQGSAAPGSTDRHYIEASPSYIYLDAGHGPSGSSGYDSGALGSGYEEADLTKELVSKIANYAKSIYGLNVYANIDCNVPFRERQVHAKNLGATSLVSIHFNSASGGATGIESYIYDPNAGYNGKRGPRSERLQAIIHNKLTDALPLYDRGMKAAPFAVINARLTNLPAALYEICFISNAGDMRTYQAHKDAVARAIAAGLYQASTEGF